MKKLFTIMIACITLFVQGYAQAPDVLPQVFSPNAAELGKYGKIPVSYFNGLPNISIPLTELKAKDYTLPIYLTYHAGGNKPDQHPGWVGQGWTLHAGGCINRIIKGIKDETSYYELSNDDKVFMSSQSENPGYLYHADDFQSIDWDNQSVRALYSHGSSYRFNGLTYVHDCEPDEFQVNIDDINASFFFVGRDEIRIVSKTDIDFSVTYVMTKQHFRPGGKGNYLLGFRYDDRDISIYDTFYEFIITKSDGTKYHFGGNEDAIEFSMMQTKNQKGAKQDYYLDLKATANTWMLTKIEKPNGEEIVLHYERDGVPIVLVDSEYWDASSRVGTNQTAGVGIGESDSNLHFSFLLPSYLKSIRSKLGRDSLALLTSKSVQLGYKYEINEFRETVARSVNYPSIKEQDYYPKLDRIIHNQDTIICNYSSDSKSRLKLNQVQIVSNSGDPLKYSMTYNTTRLPDYNSHMTDFWGYYNSTERYNVFPIDSFERRRLQVNPDLLKAEILDTLKYPTGGWTYFEYEPNDYSLLVKRHPFSLIEEEGLSGGLRIRKIADYSSLSAPEERFFSYTDANGRSSGILSGKHKVSVSGLQRDEYGQESNLPKIIVCLIGGAIGLVLYVEADKLLNEGHGGDSFNYVGFEEHGLSQLSDTDGNHITYSVVKETTPGKGTVEYFYSNHDTPDLFCLDREATRVFDNYNDTILRNPFSSMALCRGLLLKKMEYDSQKRLTSEEKCTYNQDTTDCVFSLFQYRHYFSTGINRRTLLRTYTYFPALTHKVVTTYPDDGGDPLVEETDYEYNDHRQLIKTTRRIGSGVEETRALYSGDASLANRSPYSGMQAAGILDRPVEQTVLHDGKVVSSSLITYRKSGSQYLPDKYYEAQLDGALDTWIPYSGTSVSSVYGNPKMSFDSYDEHGNILQATEEGGTHSRFYWDTAGYRPEASFAGMLTPVRNVIVEGTASQNVNFDKNLVEEYTFEFDADRTGEFSFCMSWPDCIAYDMTGTLDGTVVFDYEAPKQKGKRNNLVTMPPVDGPILTPVTEMYSGTVTAGHHSLKIVRNSEPQQVDPHTIVFNPYLRGSGWIDYPVYRTEQRSDELGAWYYDFEADGNHDIGFHSGMSWKGLKTFSKSIPSGIPYTIDWMECGSDGVWSYKTREFNGRTTIGGSAVFIDNVRIYPSEASAASWTWTDMDELCSLTDGRGITESYEYDGLNRLTAVIDMDGHKKASYAYHYASASDPMNYVKTDLHTDESGQSVRSTVTYYDGLGRPWQTVRVNAGKADPALGSNLMHLFERTDYDEAGRPFRTWLPFRSSSIRPQTGTPDESLYNDCMPFSTVVYDGSPLERPIREYGPGQHWYNEDKAVGHGYYTNDESSLLSCRKYTTRWSNDTTIVISGGRYDLVPSSTLSVERVTDEDGLTLLTFTDMYGRKVLERRHPESGENLDTYYLYDDLGRLSAVLPPALSKISSIGSSDINDYAYLYHYDSRGNCIAKKLPGCGWSFMVYDARGAMIMSQDAVQRRSGKWTLCLTDGQGRQCVTGTCTANVEVFGNPYKDVTVYARWIGDGSISGMGARTYYGHILYGMSPQSFIVNQATRWSPFGPAETFDRVLGPSAGGKVLKTTNTYDAKGRVTKTDRQTHLGGMETEQITYDFTDAVTSRTLTHTDAAGQSFQEHYTYTYDNWGRPLQTIHQLGTSSPVVLHENVYDGLGRLLSDNRNMDTRLRTSYEYNVRSWLTRINNPFFEETLAYDLPSDGATPLWGGNISQMGWRTGMAPRIIKQYTFTYDNYGRLKRSVYSGFLRGENYGTSYTYDANSNLTNITRMSEDGFHGSVNIMPLGIGYMMRGNQVIVRTQGNELYEQYEFSRLTNLQSVYYDSCGRMVRDDDRGISKITYNELSLPSSIAYAATDAYSVAPDKYGVEYAADGRKLRTGRLASSGLKVHGFTVAEDQKREKEETTLPGESLDMISVGANSAGDLNPVVSFESPTDYVGNLVYKNGVLDKILIDGGYISGGDMNYHFFVTDHLGNVRVVENAAGVIEQQNEFYPYGESIDTGAQSTSDNPYKWGGKEWDADQGAYDFGARMYSPTDARWSTMDPLCEKYYHISPYAYCAGNPVNYVDMDGCKYDEYYSSINGKYLGRDAYGGSLRLIDPKDYNRIAGTQTNVQLIPYIQELRGSSRLIVSKANQIEHDAQMVADQSREDGLEHQCYFVLNRETASIYTIDGPVGDNSSSTINYYPAPNTGCSFVDHPGGLILIGEMHGHPASNAIGHQTLKTMSPDKDVPLAKELQIPIWGIDAMDGSKGDSMGVHVAFPSGEVRNNVRQTSKSFEDWGYEALRIWGRSGFPLQ